jgi:alanyl-tRNA synthetase
MLFGEKYGDEVRVLDIGSSREFCGGTHVARTGDIGFFKVLEQGGVAAGIRRIEATTGEGALHWAQRLEEEIGELAFEFGFQKADLAQLKKRAVTLQEANKSLEKETARLKSRLAMGQGQDIAAQAVEVNGSKVLAAAIDGADAKTLRETMDKLKDRLKSAAIVLGAVSEGKVALIAGVTPESRFSIHRTRMRQ